MSDNRRKVAGYPDADSFGLFSLAAVNSLRLEAMDLLDRSLAEGKPGLLECFIERQLSEEAPPVDLLNQVAEDVHHRLIALRQRHFEVRDDVLKALRRDFDVDLSPLVPPHTLDNYHLLSLDEAFCYLMVQNNRLTDDDQAQLRKALKVSIESAGRLHKDILTAEHLYDYINDWLVGLQVVSLRSVWSGSFGDWTARQTQ